MDFEEYTDAFLRRYKDYFSIGRILIGFQIGREDLFIQEEIGVQKDAIKRGPGQRGEKHFLMSIPLKR
nr:BPK_HP1_G0042870.mRNA.1.CDS.1 [Saccharomyces cerevisiae]